jgi:hypothetical protein
MRILLFPMSPKWFSVRAAFVSIAPSADVCMSSTWVTKPPRQLVTLENVTHYPRDISFGEDRGHVFGWRVGGRQHALRPVIFALETNCGPNTDVGRGSHSSRPVEIIQEFGLSIV